jgi:hypothetical protein
MHGETPLTVAAVLNRAKPNIYPNADDDATIVLAYPRAQAIIQASWNWRFNRKDIEVYLSPVIYYNLLVIFLRATEVISAKWRVCWRRERPSCQELPFPVGPV